MQKKLTWEPVAALTLKLGDQIRHDGLWRTVTAVHVVPGISVTVHVGGAVTVSFKAGAQVMARTTEKQEQERRDAIAAVEVTVGEVRKTVAGWAAALAVKVAGKADEGAER